MEIVIMADESTKETDNKLLLTAIVKNSLKILNVYDIERTHANLAKIISIACNSLVPTFNISYEICFKLVHNLLAEQTISLTSTAGREGEYIPLPMLVDFSLTYYEDHPKFLNNSFMAFFDNLLLQEYDVSIMLAIFTTLAEIHKLFLSGCGIVVKNHYLVNEQGKEQIIQATWKHLHESNFDLVFDLSDNPAFQELCDSYFASLDTVKEKDVFEEFFLMSESRAPKISFDGPDKHQYGEDVA
jgi:hypothetical protein